MNRLLSAPADNRPGDRNGRAFDPLDPAVGDPRATAELDLITRNIAVRTAAETGVLAYWNQRDRVVDLICAWGAAPMNDRSRIPACERFGFVGRVLNSGRAAFDPIDPDRDPSLGTRRRARV